MKYTRESIAARYNAGEELTFIPFWGHTPKPNKVTKSCFSQWYDCRFRLSRTEYHTSEQYMMAQKALLFGDSETYGKIMASDNPKDYKALGREVKGFDAARWDREKYRIVLTGNLAKFSGNPELFAFLDSTGNSVLVEASPYDDIWGVKLAIGDPRIQDPNAWQGENLLGFALMETRDILRQWAAARDGAVDWSKFPTEYREEGPGD